MYTFQSMKTPTKIEINDIVIVKGDLLSVELELYKCPLKPTVQFATLLMYPSENTKKKEDKIYCHSLI